MLRILTALVMFLLPMPLLAAGKIVLVAGGGEGGDDSPALKAKLISPFGCDFDSQGRMYFVEFNKAHRLRVLGADGNVKTVAGAIEKGSRGDFGLAKNAQFNGAHSLAILPDDTILIADTWNNRIRTVHKEEVKPFAGTGIKEFGGDGGPAREARFGGVYCVAVNPGAEFIDVTDLDHRRIRRIDLKSLTVVSVAGNGKKGIPADGKKAIEEPLVDPRAAASDRHGNLYILERSGHALRMVGKNGIIKTVAGTGKAGTAIGKALESQMNGPKHLCIDKEDNVIIADSENHRILKYSPKDGTVIIVAGTGKKGAAGLNSDPLRCELNQPHGVTVHPKTGELYICDSSNHRILKIVP